MKEQAVHDAAAAKGETSKKARKTSTTPHSSIKTGGGPTEGQKERRAASVVSAAGGTLTDKSVAGADTGGVSRCLPLAFQQKPLPRWARYIDAHAPPPQSVTPPSLSVTRRGGGRSRPGGAEDETGGEVGQEGDGSVGRGVGRGLREDHISKVTRYAC